MSEVVAEVVRSGFVEGRHRGAVVALAADGSVDWAIGDVESPILPRSCNKPIQALALLRAGWAPGSRASRDAHFVRSSTTEERSSTTEESSSTTDLRKLALACASHSGEAMHVAVVREVLAEVGLDESALQTPPDWPLDEGAKEQAIRAGGEKAPVLMNCSGKHAAMLATCMANDWDTATYLEVDHPLQRVIAETFAELTGEPVAVTAVDGCGAPLLSASLTGLARAFRRLATAVDGPERQIAEAIRAHPELISGTKRDERALLAAIPGAIGKGGAEACHALALPDGRAWALKIEDGGGRARPVVLAAALERSRVLGEDGVDADAVREAGRSLLHGGGAVVGEVRPRVTQN